MIEVSQNSAGCGGVEFLQIRDVISHRGFEVIVRQNLVGIVEGSFHDEPMSACVPGANAGREVGQQQAKLAQIARAELIPVVDVFFFASIYSTADADHGRNDRLPLTGVIECGKRAGRMTEEDDGPTRQLLRFQMLGELTVDRFKNERLVIVLAFL
tara:strand:- start:88934 stop:89401 length:468 start_codon:yes stop_codon:yes gene_type:complete